MSETLRCLVFGAGAIGTYIGGSLALFGSHRVVFLERPEIAQDIRQRGLRLNLDGQEHTIAEPCLAGSLEEALAQGPFDVALFALKSFDTSPALQTCAPYANRLPPFLCLQNGVENEAVLEAALGAGKVIAGSVTSAIGRRAAGDIRLEKRRGMGIAAGHPLSERLAAALDAAGLNVRLYKRSADMKWSKMLTNLLANATSAIVDLTPAEVFAHPGLCRLEIAQLREALAVMDKLDIRPVDLPGAPVRLLALSIRALPPRIARPLLRRVVGGGRGAKMPSFHIDLHNGHGVSEVDYLNGAVVRFGRKAGVPTPINQLLNDTLLALTRGEIPLEDYRRRPERLLEK